MIPTVLEDVMKALETHLGEIDDQDTTDLSERVRFWLREGSKHLQKAMEKLQTGLDIHEEEGDLD